MENKKVNAFIEPIKVKGDILNYRMYMNYDGIDYCFLQNNQEALNTASSIQRKLTCDIKEATFTDSYGIASKKRTDNSVIGYVTGLSNISKAVIGIASACKDLDVQADFTIHLNNEEYKMVRETSELTAEDKRNTVIDGTKDIDFEEFFRLDMDMEELYQNNDLLDQKRR